MATASFSSNFLPFPLSTKSPPFSFSINPKNLIQCSSSATSTTNPKRKVWKDGEFPVASVKQPTSFGYQSHKKRTPINKKIDNKNSPKSRANTVTEALFECIDKKQWLQALQVFEILREQPFYQPKEGTYMKLIVLLGKSGQPELAGQVFDKMIEEVLEPSKELYTALVAAYCRNNAIGEAFSVLEQIIRAH